MLLRGKKESKKVGIKGLPALAYLIIFLLPCYFIRFNFLGGSISLVDVLLLVFLLGFAIYLSRENSRKTFGKFLRSGGYFFLGLGLVILGVFLAFEFNFNFSNWQDGLGIIKSFYVLPLGFAAALGFLVKKGEVKIRRLLGAYFTASSLVAMEGVIAVLQGNLTYDGRLALFFDSPNQLAIYLVPGILTGFYWLGKKRGLKAWLFFVVAGMVAFHLVALGETGSLGGWLGLLGGSLFLLWPKKYFYSLIFILYLLSSMLLGGIGPLLEKAGYSPFIVPSSSDSRVVIYWAAGKILKDHWFLGIGPGQFQETYLDYQQYFLPYPQWAVPHPHNLGLAFWLEAGLLGWLGFGWVLWQLRKVFGEKEITGQGVLVGAILFYFLFHGLVDTTFWKNDAAVMFWLVLVLFYSAGNPAWAKKLTHNC